MTGFDSAGALSGAGAGNQIKCGNWSGSGVI
jgi:hypothetical protein